MPHYKLKEGKLLRRGANNQRLVYVAGDVVEMTKEQAKTFGLNLLDLQHEEAAEAVPAEQKQKAQLTVNPAPEAGKKPTQKKA